MTDKSERFALGITLLALFFGLIFPHLGNYTLSVINMIGMYAILALSLNVILGHAGMFHMGHAAFFAIGAYTTAILNTQYGLSIFATMPLAGLAAGLVAFAVAAPIIHLRGDYLLMVTIGIVEIVRIALRNDVFGITGGENGINGIARPALFGLRFTRETRELYFFCIIWAFLLVSFIMFNWLEHSRFGRALKFIKEDVIAAASTGVNTSRYKLLAFIIGAVWAGFVGTIYASKMQNVSPGSFTFDESVRLFTIVILGGSGNQKGVLLGAFLVMGLPELFRDLATYRMLFFGAALVIMMIFRPQGLLPPRPRSYVLPQPYADKYS